MVNRCVNPACREEFKLLNAGELYAHQRSSDGTEFFWLCSTCAAKFDLYRDPAGCVSVRPLNIANRVQAPRLYGALRLVSRSNKPAPRPHTVPSGERAFSFMIDANPIASAFRARGTGR